MSIKKYTAMSVAGAVVPVILMLATTPIYLGLIGFERYGVLSLVWLFLGYFSFADIGFGKAVTNQMAALPKDAWGSKAELFWSAIFFVLSIGSVAAVLLYLAGTFYFLDQVETTDSIQHEIQGALHWLAVIFPISLLSSVLVGSLEGNHKFIQLSFIQIAGGAMFQVLPLFAAYQVAPSLDVIIPAALLSKVVANILMLYLCCRLLPAKSISFGSIGVVKKLLGTGSWVSLTSVVGTALDTAERMIIGSVLGGAAVANFSLPMQVIGKLRILPGAISKVLFPRFSELNFDDSIALAQKAVSQVATMMSFLCASLAFFILPFLEYWLGDKTDQAAALSMIFISGVWFNAVGHIPFFHLQAKGRPDLVAKVHVYELPFYIALCYIATIHGGLELVAVVWALKCAAEAVILLFLSMIKRQIFIPLFLQAVALHLVLLGVYTYSSSFSSLQLLGISTFVLLLGACVYKAEIVGPRGLIRIVR